MKFFTADTHFGHVNVVDKMGRPFSTIEEHDGRLLNNINDLVGRNDCLYIVGDFSFNNVNPRRYRHKIRCRHVFMVRGNHDPYQKTVHTFGDLPYWRHVKLIGGHHAILHHYPTAYWHGSHHGYFHLYGHCHAQREKTLDLAFPGRRSLDVGVDNANQLLGDWRPFRETEIVDLLAGRPGHDPVEFYQQ